MSRELEKTRTYESDHPIDESVRPVFHVTPWIGWMNDPNGFSYYSGQYHLFYQYNPYKTEWGPMHWGHAVSQDLVHWTNVPAALAPDQKGVDDAGCFSGSAVELEDGRQLLLYTGVIRVPGKDGELVDSQSQCIAVGDGLDYTKYESNPVIRGDSLPEGFSRIDFRDPKIWKEADGTYAAVAADRAADGTGQILLFHSEDAFHWTYAGILSENHGRYGRMWECPDFFRLDGKDVLLLSPQDMKADGLEFVPGNNTMALIGSQDPESGRLSEEKVQTVDHGLDFYATQTLLSPDGRRIMIAWMQNWDSVSHRMDDMPWFGQTCFPRELSIDNGRLFQKPVREIESLHQNEVHYENVQLPYAVSQLDGIHGRLLDLHVSLHPEEDCRSFTMHLAEGEDLYTEISYDPVHQRLTFDRSHSGAVRACMHERTIEAELKKGRLDLRILMDRYSIEIFINDGEKTMSSMIYTDLQADGISFTSEGSAEIDVDAYTLKDTQA
jgi:beta-fructofuranosidase